MSLRWNISLTDQILFDRIGSDVGYIVQIVLLHQIGTVLFDGLDAQAKVGRDVFIRAPFRHQLEHLALTVSQSIPTIGRAYDLARAQEDIDDFVRDIRAQVGLVVQHTADGGRTLIQYPRSSARKDCCFSSPHSSVNRFARG